MHELTATQASQDRPGRWRCLLCRSRRWRRGTLRDSLHHYTDIHMKQEDGHNDQPA